MKPAPVAVLAAFGTAASHHGVGAAAAAPSAQYEPFARRLSSAQTSSPFTGMQSACVDMGAACVPWVGDAPLVVACNQCVEVTGSGDIVIPDGIDIHGRLVFSDSDDYVHITTPFVFVQGLLEIKSDREVKPENKRVTFTLTGTADQVMTSATGNTACAGDGCNFGPKPFVVAGGKVDVQAFPATSASGSTCPTWTKLHSVQSGSMGALTSDQYDAQIVPPSASECGDHVFDHYFASSENTWTQGEGDEAGATCALNGADATMTVKDRLRTYQGPTIDLTHRTGCILPDVDYLFTARVKMSKAGESGPTKCKASGSECLKVENWIMYGDDTEVEQTPTWASQTKGTSGDYDEWFDFTATMRFDQADLTDITFNALVLSGPGAGVDISMSHVRLTLPDASSYSGTCNELVLNGDAEGNGIHPHPAVPSSSTSRALIVEEQGGNKFYRNVDRVSRWDTIKFPVNKHCAVKNQVYRASAKVRIHSESPLGYEIELRKCTTEACGTYTDYVVATCPPQKELDGFVQCAVDVTLPEDIGGGASYHLRLELGKVSSDSEKWVVDVDDFSFSFQQGPVRTIVLPEDVRGCWGPGSEVLLTSHTLDNRGEQVGIIESVTEGAVPGTSNVILTDSIIQPTDQTGAFPQMAVEVALLSRNVGITGADDQGGYFSIYHTTDTVQTVQGIEFINMGQQEVYKWAVGVHMCGPLPNSSVSKNAIVDSNHRCVTLQNVQDMVVADNVALNHQGHCYATNDGPETGNSFLHNLGAKTESSAIEMNNGYDMEDRSYPSTFFARGAANIWEGNVAAGSTYRGWWFHIMNDMKGESAGVSGNPQTQYLIQSFKDNSAHSNDNDGFRFDSYRRGDKANPNTILENVNAYHNGDYGVYFYYSMNTGIDGGFVADNTDGGIYIRRCVGITPLSNLEIRGETSTQKDLELLQGAPALDCGGTNGSPSRGIRMDTYKRYSGFNVSSDWSDIHFADWDHMNKCNQAKSTPIYFNSDEQHERFNWATSMTNVTVDDSRGLQLYACDVENNRGVNDIIFLDLDGSFHPTNPDYAGPGIVVSDNDKTKGFAGGACQTLSGGGCMAYCENTCPRTVTFYTEPSGTEDYTLVVKDKDGDQREVTVDGKFYRYSTNSMSTYNLKRSFAVSLPTGQYTAEFRDGNNDPAWPVFVQEIWSDVPRCPNPNSHANPGDVELAVTALVDGECDQLVKNGDMNGLSADNSFYGPWKRSSATIEPVADGHTDTTGIKHKGRSSVSHNIGQWIDMRCVANNTYYNDPARPNRYKQYEFSAWFRLVLDNGEVGDTTCDPEDDNHNNGCPELSMRYEYYNSADTKDSNKAANKDVKGETVRPFIVGGWNELHGVFSWDHYRGEPIVEKSAIEFIVEHYSHGQDIILDDVSLTPVDGTCDELVFNGDFATGTAKYWDTYRQNKHRVLDLVEGTGGGDDTALRARDRTYDKATSMASHMKLGCLLKDEFYVARAKYRIELASNPGTYIACKPDHHNSGSVLDRCPDMRIYSYLRDAADDDDHGTEKTKDGNINVANAVAPTTTTGWNKLVGFYKGTDHEEISEELKMYFYGLDKSYNLIIDDVSFKPHPLSCDTNLILNPSFETGDAEFWSFRSKSDRGLVDIIEGSSGPDSHAVRIYNRNEHDWSSLHTRLDSRCFQIGQKYEVQANFKLLNSTGGGQECEVSGGDTGNSGTRCPVVKIFAEVCGENVKTSGSSYPGGTLVNEPADGIVTWNKDEFNPFYNIFPVNADLASCKDVYVEITDVNRDWDVVFTDVSVTLLSQPTTPPVQAPTFAPVTSAPVMDGTHAPTVSPTDAPTLTSVACPPAGSKATVAAGSHSFDVVVGTGQLCTLTRTSTVDGAVTAVVPLGRSYENQDWGSAAGQIAASLLGEWRCYESACEIDLPALEAGDEYVLTGYDHGMTDEDTVARFLEQTTFGTTRGDLNAWAYTGGLEASMAAYVEKQMDGALTPMTSHREYWRKRTNAKWTFPQPVAQPSHPCDANSRWRRAAFTSKDHNRNNWEHYLTVRTVGDRTILAVDGQDRTSVAAGTFKFQDAAYDTFVFEEGTHYLLCRSYNYLGKSLRLTHPTDGCKDIAGGNPAVDFTGLAPERTVSLPVIGTASGELRLIDTHEGDGTEHYLIEDALTGGSCDAVVVVDYRDPPVVGTLPDGTYLIHDPRVDLPSNVPSVPLADGGGAAEFDTVGKTLCSNAPRTFLNFDQCHLSTEPQACGDVAAPPTPIVLNDANIRTIHDLTDTTANGDNKRYIYGVKGLVVKQVNHNTSAVTYQVQHPCTNGHRSRWMRTPGVCVNGTTPLGDLTTSVLTDQIIKWGKEQDNPLLRDVNFPNSESVQCDANDTDYDTGTVEITLEVEGDCFTHVHPDYLSVYDMTYWTLDYTHPGNMVAASEGEYNPIKKWMDLQRDATLTFPSTFPEEYHGNITHDTHNHTMDAMLRRRTEEMMDMQMMMMDNAMGGHPFDHPMTRWEMHNVKFTYVGRMYDTIYFRDLPNELRLDEVAEHFNATGDVAGAGIMVCGSPGEVQNDPSLGDHGFDVASNDNTDTSGGTFYKRQKEVTWTMTVLNADDQLRQRMAWALSQILVVVPGAVVAGHDDTEIFLAYYDIFVRHAFGNYRDVLREVSYSAMMAENLSYLQSKSHAYMREKFGQLAFADENFAREIMQLFTVGLFGLNTDGTLKLDDKGNRTLTYTNEDIMNFARGWTGFDYQKKRGNTEEIERSRNRLDPMKIDATWRDKFPKLDLYGGYIGDQYPLCVDLPSSMFLRKGATYRLLGSVSLPEKMYSDPAYLTIDADIAKFKLGSDSKLKEQLCGTGSGTTCTPIANEIVLNANLMCEGEECNVDSVRVVQVSSDPDLYYEYVRPPCVELAFYTDAKKLSFRKKSNEGTMCGNPQLAVAQEACCTNPYAISDKTATMFNKYDGERVTYATADSRCDAPNAMCDFDEMDSAIAKVKTGYHWTKTGATNNCFIDIKVNADGRVAIVYRMNAYTSKVMHVDDGTLNYFPVAWTGGVWPGKDAAEGCPASCSSLPEGGCRCETTVAESAVFYAMPSSIEDILANLHVGAQDVASYDATLYTKDTDSVTGISVHKVGSNINSDSVFEVTDPKTGRTHFLKNVKSTVSLTGSGFSFRNSPHFVSLIPTETDVRDAEYETEAILDHYFYQENTAPFLAVRFIQRFGVSNPTPAFVTAVATAFRTGTFTAGTTTFGGSGYGDLEATAAAVILHPEARSVVLDADPASGSLKEPLMKVVGTMRSLGFATDEENALIRWNDVGLENSIGQMAHQYPTVFSFFLPEYVPSGRCTSAGVVSPESMMVDMPKTISLLNGLFSMVRHGFTNTHDGLGRSGTLGHLNYETAGSPTEAEIVDDLATLLTSGRLSAANRAHVVGAMDAIDGTGSVLAKFMAQQLIATSAEFHSTNIVTKDAAATRDDAVDNSGASTVSDYKSVVFLMFGGGCDSYHMLIPGGRSVCAERPHPSNANETWTIYDQYLEIREDVALDSGVLLPIDATDAITGVSAQECDTFGLHPNLPVLQQLYIAGEAIFVANAGVLTKKTDKNNYREDTVTNLFAHNTMQHEGRSVDPFEKFAGSGVMGRMTDVLHRNGIKTSAISIDSASNALVGKPGESPAMQIVSRSGIKKFNVDPVTDAAHMRTKIEEINSATAPDSGIMAETWSANLHTSLSSNEQLLTALESAETNTTFPDSTLGDQLEMVTKLMQTAPTRGVDRDFFYVQMGGYDTHSMMQSNLVTQFTRVNDALEAFTDELRGKGLWEDTVLVQVSDFARTLTPNSGDGTDHAWGGNYFIVGGGLDGGKILGKYPENIYDGAPLNVGRGRIIPTTSWDHIWNAVAQWTGVTAGDLNEVLPNKGNFDDLFEKDELFAPASRRELKEKEKFLRKSGKDCE